MAIPTLSGSYIDETYIRLVQVSGSEFADGEGNPISFGAGTLSGGINGYIPVWSGSTALSNSLLSQISNTLNVSGSISASNGYTGSLEGTASWALNVLTASYIDPLFISASAASYGFGSGSSTTLNIDTGSFATTGSNTFTGPQIISSSLSIEQTLTQYKRLDGVTPGTTTLLSQPTGSYNGLVGTYTLINGLNIRAGQYMTAWVDTQIISTDTSTGDIGSTANIIFSSSLSDGNVNVYVICLSSGWTVKMLATCI